MLSYHIKVIGMIIPLHTTLVRSDQCNVEWDNQFYDLDIIIMLMLRKTAVALLAAAAHHWLMLILWSIKTFKSCSQILCLARYHPFYTCAPGFLYPRFRILLFLSLSNILLDRVQCSSVLVPSEP